MECVALYVCHRSVFYVPVSGRAGTISFLGAVVWVCVFSERGTGLGPVCSFGTMSNKISVRQETSMW